VVLLKEENNSKMSIFDSITDYLVETSDQIIKVVEEVTELTFKADSAEDDGGGSGGEFGDEMDEAEDLFDESPLAGIADGVVKDIFKNQSGPQTVWENIEAFSSAITWKEPFIIALIAFHVSMFIATILVIRCDGIRVRVAFLIFLAIIVRSVERLNQYGSTHWHEFATQNYFDEGGIFASLMISLPLVIFSFLMLISYLREASQLLVEVKRREITEKRRKKGSKSGKTSKKNIGKEE